MFGFEIAVAIILHHEGGYVDNPADPGGATRYGISLRFLRDEHIDVDGDGDVDADDVKGLTLTKAIALYREKFWDRYGYAAIRNPVVAVKLFDMCVNMGPRQAHKILQTSLVALGFPVAIDGVLGPKTLFALNACAGWELVLELTEQHAEFYDFLVAQRPTFSQFHEGWLRRAAWPFTKQAADMINAAKELI
jgi:lysozyme family protein